MATHNGQLIDHDVYVDESGSPVHKRNQTAIADGIAKFIYPSALKGTRVFQSKVPQGANKPGIFKIGFVADFLYERIWFKPLSIDAGFVVDEQTFYVSVWNAYQFLSKQITDITGTNTEGTQIIHGTTPITLPPDGEEQHTIKVLKDGPPSQNTTYDYTIDGSHYITTILGSRILPFPYPIDWGADPVVSIHLKSAISKNKRFVEQRRPIFPKALRKTNYTFKINKLVMQKALNILESGSGRLFGVPIHSEAMTPLSVLTGQAIITTKEDLTYLWNLQKLTKYVILIDEESEGIAIKEIASLSAYQITFKTIIQETLNYLRTMMYPIILAIPGAIKPKSMTDQFINLSIEFSEINIGQ